MASQHLFTPLQINPHFWSPLQSEFPAANDILTIGYLSSPPEKGATTTCKYVLTATRLIEIQHQSENALRFREGDIRWVTVEPFYRKTNQGMRYGFTIAYRDEKLDFYGSSDSESDQWLQKLQSVCILRDFESAYSLGAATNERRGYIIHDGVSLETGEKVSIRHIRKSAMNPKMFTSLISEILAFRLIAHPTVPKLHRVYESSEDIYLVLEHLHGVLLSESIAEQTFSQTEAKTLIVNLLDLLAYLQDKAILHRDIKPKNLLLVDQHDRSKFKIIDFSIARMYGDSPIADLLGSPGFIAPEVLITHQYGPAVDIYSAGVVFYMLIAGRHPFESPNRTITVGSAFRRSIAFGLEWKDVGERTRAIIQRMTNFSPTGRLTAKELKSLLLNDDLSLPPIPKSEVRRGSVDSMLSISGNHRAARLSLASFHS